MPAKRVKRKAPKYSELTHAEQRRRDKLELARAVQQEKAIQSLANRLDREMRRTDDRIQKLATVLSSHARALEAERDVDRSLAPAGDRK